MKIALIILVIISGFIIFGQNAMLQDARRSEWAATKAVTNLLASDAIIASIHGKQMAVQFNLGYIQGEIDEMTKIGTMLPKDLK